MNIENISIKNRSGFISALLGVLASIVMAMGSDGLLGSIANATSDWGNVQEAVERLHSYDLDQVGESAFIQRGDPNFQEFSAIIESKVPWLKNSPPDAYLMNTPATMGGAPTKVVHAIIDRQSKAISEFYVIENWLSQEKQKDYLYKGLFILLLSFGVASLQFVRFDSPN